MDVVLIVNPQAGGGRARRVLPAALAQLQTGGCRPQVHFTANGREPATVAAQAAGGGASLVVAVGGDGHASAVAGGLLGSESALGLLPVGSANDYARTIGLDPADIDGAVRALLQPRLRRLDVVRVETAGEQRHILNVGGAGFDSVVAATAERIPVLRGAGRYVLAVVRELPRYRAADFQIELDGVSYHRRAMVVIVANGPTYGGGMRVAPAARLASGHFDVCIVAELSPLRFLLAFPRVFRGTHIDHPE